MNLRLARLLKLHGLYCSPAGDEGADAGTGDGDGGAHTEDDAEEGEQDEGEEGRVEGAEAPVAAEEDGEIVVSLGEPAEGEEGEEDPNRAPAWVKKLRESSRDKDKRIRELERQVAASTPAPTKIVVGARPKLEDFGFDAEDPAYIEAMDKWYAEKADADRQEREAKESAEKQRTQWLGRLDAVVKTGKALPVRDHDEALEAFEGTFSTIQQGIIIGGPDDVKTSAMLRYALGKNPAEAKRLAAIADPIKFAVEVGAIMTKLKTEPRRTAPPPDASVRSNVAGAAAVDNEIDRLRAEARKTGNYDKVAEYNRHQASKKAAAQA